MISRIRIALSLALLLALLTSVIVYAKERFAFITVTGANMKDEVRISDPELTEDFFTFAEFQISKTTAPVDPGRGYEITRFYIDGNRDIAFDRLHYYPDTGFVFYDGIVNGSSEYDGEWYTAKAGIKTKFEGALSVALSVKSVPLQSSDQAQVGASVDETRAATTTPSQQYALFLSVAAGLLALVAIIIRRPRPSAQ